MSRRSGHKRSGGTSSSSASCSGDTSPPSALLKHCCHTPTSLTPYQSGCQASSPRLTPLSQPRSAVARSLRFGMARDIWTPNVLLFFIDALVDECRAGNRPHKTLNRIGKDNVVQRMKDYTEADWDWETCKNKWDELKKKWSCWKSLLKWSGVTFHPNGTINMPTHWWDDRIAENKMAKFFKRHRLEHEDKLDYIFSNMEPVNVGPGGHEGGRAGVPTQHLDSDTSDDSDDDQQPTPQPMRTTSMISASYGKRRSCDPPVSGADFWDGLKKFMNDVPAPKKQKQTDNACKKAEDDVEYEELMRELLDAGVDPKSDEYFMASEVLLEAPRRGAYRPLPDIESKIQWTKKAYLSMKGRPPCL